LSHDLVVVRLRDMEPPTDPSAQNTGAAGEMPSSPQLDALGKEALEMLVRSHGGRLLRTVRRLLLNEEDARDAVQEAFLSAVRSLDDFRGEAQLSSWLHRIAINAALIKLRARRRVREQPIEELLPGFRPDGEHLEPIHPWAEPCEANLERQELQDLVRAAIARLPEDYRVILSLRDLEGLDTKETAHLLGISVGAVKTRLHRARQALRTLLDPHFRRDAP